MTGERELFTLRVVTAEKENIIGRAEPFVSIFFANGHFHQKSAIIGLSN